MAAAAPEPFKLVLVGDGGTGKVSDSYYSPSRIIKQSGASFLDSKADDPAAEICYSEQELQPVK
jgi:hypothetical protein